MCTSFLYKGVFFVYPNNYIKKLVANIPDLPGVYQMKDENGNVIYVGKAISLKRRVRQYFQKNNKSKRIENMVELIRDIEFIITKNEAEALALECNYIKQKHPKFNVMLKDDKTYPYLKITIKDEFPTLYITRRKINDGNLYFGPYTDVSAIKETLHLIREIFPLKRCKKNFKNKKQVSPCLYYHISRCLGPCSNQVNKKDYDEMIHQVISFLQGKRDDLRLNIKEQIDECISSLEFEKAQILKQRLDSIEKIYEKQNVSNLNEINSDIIGYVYNENNLYIQVFKIRDYKIVLNDNLVIPDILEGEVYENIISIVSRYYLSVDNLPKKIYIKLNESNFNLLKEFFKVKDLKVECIVPKKGQKLKLIDMVENNIKINLESKKNNAIFELSNLLKVQEIDSIECFDIANLRNDSIVGGMIRFEDGKLNKSMYRKYKIKSTITQDDPKCMAEIIKRRLKRKDEWNLPDLFLIDGGKTQLQAVKKVLDELEEDVLVYGMVKDSNHRTRALMRLDGEEIDIKQHKNIFNFITFLQDEIHRFTISYHRSIRDRIEE